MLLRRAPPVDDPLLLFSVLSDVDDDDVKSLPPLFDAAVKSSPRNCDPTRLDESDEARKEEPRNDDVD